ncbi:hypothetical protein ILUMI_05423 [Ignelater luminosus]|uniref:Uncharacterized protein n=1 Tax=Ignelater luminosus TaxID=2038154 RepID=A0A8K0D753_IGNLU|nr:hypothetical protein ILUMI_05423 [Ignelater luminosus]
MEVDSMHSTIEKKLKKAIINVPADYVTICQFACTKSPYHVEYLSHSSFKNLEQNLRFFKSIRPGKEAGDLTVNDVKEIKHTSNMIFYKLRHSEEEDEKPLPVRMDSKVKARPFSEIHALYNCRLKIKKEKYDHLQLLKKSIQPDYHKFYDDLPHN